MRKLVVWRALAVLAAMCLMTGLLMIFFLLFNHFRVSPSPLVVFTMTSGHS